MSLDVKHGLLQFVFFLICFVSIFHSLNIVGVVVKEITKADLAEKESAIEIAVDDLEKARKLLTEGGVKIMREVEERSTLEDYYFKLVGGGKE